MKQSGIFIINKPTGWTTHDVVQKIKHKLGVKKIGHAGTLDPLATGVVICLINNGTKISDFLLNADKQYLVTMKLFTATDSYDIDGQITQQDQPFSISEEQVKAVVEKYNGLNYDQTPPIYSAIKLNGKKLYEYARNNQTVEIAQRNVTIKNLELIKFANDEITLKVDCSKGTYVRSLIVDIAHDLGTVAHVTMLERTKSGKFDLANAQTIENVQWSDLIDLKNTLLLNDNQIINYSNIEDVLFGKKIKLNEKHDLVFIQDSTGTIIACYKRDRGDIFKCLRGGFNL